MAGINSKRVALALAVFLTIGLTGCVSTEELYAEYDAFDCELVARTDASGAVSLHEQNTDTHYPWEPAVYFEFDSHKLSEAAQTQITTSIQLLKDFPVLVLGLQGFTDKHGTSGYNLELAERRVIEVKRFIASQGISENRLVLQPIGELLPQIAKDDDIARGVNRRVELMLLDDVGRPISLQYAMN